MKCAPVTKLPLASVSSCRGPFAASLQDRPRIIGRKTTDGAPLRGGSRHDAKSFVDEVGQTETVKVLTCVRGRRHEFNGGDCSAGRERNPSSNPTLFGEIAHVIGCARDGVEQTVPGTVGSHQVDA